MMRSTAGLTWVLGLLVAGSGPAASAVTVDFESPSYATGTIDGQEGWAVPGYAVTTNGSLEVSEVSTTGPLAGAQSLSYTRTEAGLAATARDVFKADVVTVAKDGTPAPDLNASFLISSSSLATQGMGFGVDGFFLSPNGAGGSTPIGILLRNAGSSIPGIEEFADNGGSPAFFYFGGSLAAAAFPENDTLEFEIDVDFDSSTYAVAYRNVTTGGPLTPSGITRGFALAYPANPNGTYDVDVIAAFRYGAGRIDNITLTGNIVPEPATLGLSLAGVAAMCLRRRNRR
jgi:hypothetical protein